MKGELRLFDLCSLSTVEEGVLVGTKNLMKKN